MPIDTDKAVALQRAAVEALWRRGNLKWLLHSTQLLIRSTLEASPHQKFLICTSRRLGKTFLLLVMALEKCLQQPGARVLLTAPFAKDGQELAQDTLVTVLETCPEDLRPEWRTQAKELVFKNGSILRVKGLNNESAEFLRGGTYHLVLMDEVGSVDSLSTILASVITPTTLTTQGKIILATTPPTSLGHDSAAIYEQLAARGATAVFTLKDAPHVLDQVKISYLEEAGETPEVAEACIKGNAIPKTTTAQREYFAIWTTDSDSAVIPEFTRELEAEIVKEWQRPPYYYSLVSLDPGFQDMSAALFAYVDFAQGKLIVEDEFLIAKANTEDIAAAIQAKEKMLWANKPYLRVSDVDLRLQADLQAQHGLSFICTKKEDSQGAINFLRLLISSKRFIIHPRCVHLIRQLRNATFNRKGTDFARGRGLDSHYDLVASAKYLARNAPFHANPYPHNWTGVGMPGGPPAGSWISPKNRKKQNDGLFIDTPLTRRLKKAVK